MKIDVTTEEGLNRIRDIYHGTKIVPELCDEIERLKSELFANAKMLAKQTDLAREAEMEILRLQATFAENTLMIKRAADLARKANDEITRLREHICRSMICKTLSVEMPSKENNMSFYVTAPWADSEKALAEAMKEAILGFSEVLKEVYSKDSTIEAECQKERGKAAEKVAAYIRNNTIDDLFRGLEDFIKSLAEGKE